ncbi:glycosyltransferase family 4 protein [Candidatus Roizmanbacteria bacterium]|nr:glycosyltransferase family 4 protein [Candidatus Roizmanbacteria bacterium]
MKKKIGIDARLYFQTGVGTYLRNLLYYLQKIDPSEFEFYVYVLESDEVNIIFNKKNFIKRRVSSYWHTLGEQTRFLYEIYKDKVDLMHFTYFSYPVLYKRSFVSTIHDTTPLFFKTGKASTKNPFTYEIKHRVFKSVLKSQVKNALKIITPTKTVKKQLIHLYGHSYGEKIIPIYEGVDRTIQKTQINGELSKTFKDPFFIYIGNFYPHKNVETLVRAFSKVIDRYKLVLIGPKDYFARHLTQLVDELKLDKRIFFYHYATPADLKFFYINAQALIHPSFSEGFGLPLVEAAYCNCPVIASNIDVFKELLNEEYVSFDPNDEDELVKKIHHFLGKKPMFDYKHIVSRYSFEQMTKETLAVYTPCLR